MSLKSLTSIRKIIDIIHRYGYCISYPDVEELETEVTYTSVQNSKTKNDKDTLYDTVGIIYQNVDLHTPNESQLVNLFSVNNEETVISKKRRRRTFEAITVYMQEEQVAKRKKNYIYLSAHNETMKQSKKICEEGKQSSIQVTYDLAIAKVALQIQATKKPDFDNL
ncbi:uncharacterized protein TNIN_438811 [Trichonephila inaurata madagascariensis]|uniref:Uncharacterized protein n=1 Tax=Trichonephila inaurata madagascariensis TaxID=2747483 RepID=A0A8X6XYD8_9ARAC|nr:uncharacterized protein TNIN_438811 [Trichonephila inaurata madagascariensis]